MNMTDNCPIWNIDCKFEATNGDSRRFESPRAGGKFELSRTAEVIVRAWGDEQLASKVALSQVILEANLNKATPYFSSDDVGEGSQSTRPRKTIDSLNLLLKLAQCRAHNVGVPFLNLHDILGLGVDQALLNAIGSKDTISQSHSVSHLLKFLEFGRKQGLLEEGQGNWTLSLQGLDFLDQIGLNTQTKPSIFVAMWFGDDEVTKFYENAVKPAIEAAGYICCRIDETHHNERIDEQILAEIRNSVAVIVDVTFGLAEPKGWSSVKEVGAPRGGVYFEAGFAAGLGRPIIWTVKQSIVDVENVVHFDVRQYNQLRWDDDLDEARIHLQARIESTLGKHIS